MTDLKNPVRPHRASKQPPAFSAGQLPSSNYTPIFVGRIFVGKVQDGEFIKEIYYSKHALRFPPGFAFSKASLQQAEKAGARTVKIIDKETGNIYRAAISTIWAEGFNKNYQGYEPQIGLELHLWTKGDEPLSEQLKLWGGL